MFALTWGWEKKCTFAKNWEENWPSEVSKKVRHLKIGPWVQMFLKIGLENNQLNTVFFYSQNVSPVEPEMFGTAIAKIENVSIDKMEISPLQDVYQNYLQITSQETKYGHFSRSWTKTVSSSFLTWVIMTFPNILAPFKFNVTFTISAILAGNESIILSL